MRCSIIATAKIGTALHEPYKELKLLRFVLTISLRIVSIVLHEPYKELGVLKNTEKWCSGVRHEESRDSNFGRSISLE